PLTISQGIASSIANKIVTGQICALNPAMAQALLRLFSAAKAEDSLRSLIFLLISHSISISNALDRTSAGMLLRAISKLSRGRSIRDQFCALSVLSSGMSSLYHDDKVLIYYLIFFRVLRL